MEVTRRPGSRAVAFDRGEPRVRSVIATVRRCIMWEVVGTAVGMLVLFLVLSLLPYIFDLPESVAKFLGGKFQGAHLEKRLCALEAQMKELRGAVVGQDVSERATDRPEAPRNELGGATDITCQVPQHRLAWDARLEAASAIKDRDIRDEAFAGLAGEAAAAGEHGVVQMAIGKIAAADVRNETTCSCAIRLARAGKSAEAIELAKAVSDESQRDETLAQMATG
jgi:hypothetical protein